MAQAALLELRALIETQHAVGEQLPNEMQLAERLDVSRTTIREALGVLSTEGVIHRRWGVGTFISAPGTATPLNMSVIQSYRERVQATGRTVTLGDASCSLEQAPAAAQSALRLDDGAQLWVVHRVFVVDDVLSAYHTEYIPPVLLGRPIDPHVMLSIDVDLFEMLDRHSVGVVARTVTDVEAVAAGEVGSRTLGVPESASILRAEQITYAAADAPLVYGVSLQRTDVVRMRITR